MRRPDGYQRRPPTRRRVEQESDASAQREQSDSLAPLQLRQKGTNIVCSLPDFSVDLTSRISSTMHLTPQDRLFVLTGSRISAESGLATFRRSRGLWNGHSVEELSTPDA